jgi:hypothetical protein
VLAAGAILNAGTETEKGALLPGIAAGETNATLAWVEDIVDETVRMFLQHYRRPRLKKPGRAAEPSA